MLNQKALQIYQLKLIAVIDNMELLHKHNRKEMRTVESFDNHSFLLLWPFFSTRIG